MISIKQKTLSLEHKFQGKGLHTGQVANMVVKPAPEGAGIVLHGLRHERWWDWNALQIEADIRQSYQRLHEQGFWRFRSSMAVPVPMSKPF